MIISEFGGGLGDVITLMYHSDRYNRLENLGPADRAMIVLMSHNPHAKELFLWHPKAKQFTIRDVGFWWPWEDEKKRMEHQLPPAQPLVLARQPSAKFYPAPSDIAILKTLESFPYIVISAAAGGPDRNFPETICEDIAETVTGIGHRKYGLRAIVVGRRYGLHQRKEYQFRPRGGMVDLIDQLTVPGTIELVARSRGVVACHSAICLIAWYLNKPVFLGYPPDVRRRDFERPAHQYTFGKDNPTTIHFQFEEYQRSMMERFIDIAGMAR